MPYNFEATYYTYDELSKSAKQKALEWARLYLIDTEEEDENLTECFTGILRNRGMDDPEVHFNLNNCQGDGVAFEGKLDIVELCRPRPENEAKETGTDIALTEEDQHLVESLREIVQWCQITELDPSRQLDVSISCEISQKCHLRYYHWNSMNVECLIEVRFFGGGWTPNAMNARRDEADAKALQAQAEIADAVKRWSHAMEKIGYACLEANRDDEYVAEQIKNGGYLFAVTGSRWDELPKLSDLPVRPTPPVG
jgi:hypothetical protein